MKTKLEEALEKNATWELVTLPDGKSTVGCRRVFIVKHKADGSVERYKARLVEKGYTQSFRVNYQKNLCTNCKAQYSECVIITSIKSRLATSSIRCKKMLFYMEI